MLDYDTVYVCIVFRIMTTISFRFILILAALDNECVYIQVNCDEKTTGEHAEVTQLSPLWFNSLLIIDSSNIFYPISNRNILNRYPFQ